MAIQRIRGVEIRDDGVLEGVPKISRHQRRFMEARVRKIAAVGAVTQRVSAMHRMAHEQLLEETRQGVVTINGHDAWVERLGSDAAETHAVVKSNFYQTQMGFLQQLNVEARTLHEDLLDELAALPDAFWYDNSLKDRLAAALVDGVDLALEDRGLPQLTIGESFKQLVRGDVVSRKAADFDLAQSAQRQSRRAEVRAIAASHAQAAALAMGAESAGELPASVLTPEEREALLQEALRRRNSRRQEMEDFDGEIIDER